MNPTEDGPDRGQLLVIIALLLGMVFVILAVVVNSAVFAENIATRETVDSERTTAFTAGTESAIEARYDRTNDNGSRTAVRARSTFNETMRTWSDQRADVAAQEGALYRANWTTHVGWRMQQPTDDSFAPADDRDATDWTVVEGTRNVSTLRLEIARSSLYDGTAGVGTVDDEAFRLNVSDGTTDWELYVFRDSDNDSIVVHQGDPGTFGSLGELLDDSKSCSRNTNRAVIDFLTMTIDAAPCSALSFEDDLSGEVSIRYEHVHDGGDERVNGTYTVVVNGSDAVATNGTDHPARFNVSGQESPTASAIVYAVDYEASYDGGEIDHEREARYTPRLELY